MKTKLAFWDTSAIVPLLLPQPGFTVRARRLVRQHSQSVVWWATHIEVLSALARLRQSGDTDETGYQHGLRAWATFRAQTRVIEPREKVLALAAGLPEKYGLRALDSFQLAAALGWCQERARHRPFVCFDEKLAEAAEKAGFTVVN